MTLEEQFKEWQAGYKKTGLSLVEEAFKAGYTQGESKLREALESAVEAMSTAIAMHDTAGCPGESCQYPYDLQKIVRSKCRAALVERDPHEWR